MQLRFTRDAQAAGCLSHPAIITVYQFGREEDFRYIAMELVAGGSRDKQMQLGQPWPVESAMKIVKQIAEALDYAHAHGIVHRDIKPGNILVQHDRECYDDEKPAHRVTITKGFWMGQTDVTQQAYERVVGKNPTRFNGAKLPVENVDWNEAQSYCKALDMRLPAEAEWEFAARAGTTGSRYGDLDKIARYSGNSNARTHEVMQKEPNAWGLYDMLGNVWQWAGDLFEDRKYNKRGGSSSLRGGSSLSSARLVRVSDRNRVALDGRSAGVGFRCLGLISALTVLSLNRKPKLPRKLGWTGSRGHPQPVRRFTNLSPWACGPRNGMKARPGGAWWIARRRRDESRRGTQECVRHRAFNGAPQKIVCK